MAITLEASGAGAITASDPFSITLPSAYTTVLGDCIVIAVGHGGTGFISSGSGCGATWVITDGSSSNFPDMEFIVGYGCSAGGTSVSLSGSGGAAGDYAIGVFSGLASASNPVVSTALGTTAAASSCTSASLSYTNGQLLVAASAGNSTQTYSGVTWSNGQSTNLVGDSTTSRNTRLDYVIASATSSTTVTTTWSSGTHTLNQVIANLKTPPANTGNMLSVL